MRRFLAVLLATAAVAVAVAVPSSAHAVLPGGNGKVAFAKTGLGGQPDIWTMNPDGTGAVNLTQSAGKWEFGPVWSPDRTKIVYARYDGNSFDTLSVWQLDRVRVFDGGADGDGDTVGDNTLFATAGVFVP